MGQCGSRAASCSNDSELSVNHSVNRKMIKLERRHVGFTAVNPLIFHINYYDLSQARRSALIFVGRQMDY